MKIRKGIFQGDVLLPLFVIALTPLNHRVRKCTEGYKFIKSKEKINQFVYIDNVKLFAKIQKKWRLIQTIRIYNQDIGMEFGIEKCIMLIMRSKKRKITEGIELPDQERIRMLEEKENYTYLGI